MKQNFERWKHLSHGVVVYACASRRISLSLDFRVWLTHKPSVFYMGITQYYKLNDILTFNSCDYQNNFKYEAKINYL